MKNTSIVSLSQNEIFTVSGGSNAATAIIAGVGIIGSGLVGAFLAKDNRKSLSGLLGALATTTLIIASITYDYIIKVIYKEDIDIKKIIEKNVVGGVFTGVATNFIKGFFDPKSEVLGTPGQSLFNNKNVTLITS